METVVQSREQAAALANRLVGFSKLQSWLQLIVLGFPTLTGLVIERWDSGTPSVVRRFADQLGVPELLVRTDSSVETGRYPRGGFLVRVDEIDVLPQRAPILFEHRRVLFLLEPASPFDDLYSIGVACWPDEPTLIVEIVGPGFDASDLKRGDTTPHESIRASRSSAAPVIVDRSIVSPPMYRESWSRRLTKVGRMVTFGPESSTGQDEVATEEATRRALAARGETLLLTHEPGYVPIPEHLLVPVVSLSASLPVRLQRIGLPGEPLMVSMSYVGQKARPVWWDVVWPSRKYQVAGSLRHIG